MPYETPTSVRRPFNQVASFTPSVAVIYSTSVLNRAAIGCRDAFQELAPAHRVKI